MSATNSAAAAKPEKKAKAKKSEDTEEMGGKYSKTVNLPQTKFDQRANSVVREPEIQKFWDDEKIYEKIYESNTGSKFVLHDGPPYANGDLHIGHALNKILKDFINRYHILAGRKVRFVPGWDCHGLPIELKVLQSMKADERRGLTPIALRKRAAAFARETVDKQRASFRRYGVWGDWNDPYLTLHPKFEAAQIQVFADMVAGGHIYRGRKPVHWSPSSRTALAEAELEYPEGHVSRSLYAAFKVSSPSTALAALVPAGADVEVAIWTTTPWTLPANLAVAVNDKLVYALAQQAGGRLLVVAKDLVEAVGSKMGAPGEEGAGLRVLGTLTGAELAGTRYKHPLYDREGPVVVGGDYITTETGTGLVHTAPGHGVEDYQTGLKYGLALLSPVDDAGRFTAEAGPALEGKDVLADGNQAVLELMGQAGALLKEEAYGHKYPYDWRTKKPTIFRATDQWFASVESFRKQAVEAVDGVTWIPAVGRNRILPMIEGRADWCISRQRSWGVPIPVFYHKTTGEALLTAECMEHVRRIVEERGSDAWWELSEEELLPPSHKADAGSWERGRDTMDVWFDSGSSWAGVVGAREQLGPLPADMYLEGSDQHRGWFQSSLLTSVAATGRAPYKTVLTHGFVLDEKGLKMSKSLGNVVDPSILIQGGSNAKTQPAWGADVLRLWVASVDYTGDVRVGANIMRQVSDAYRKIRNTLRYMLGNLHDFDPAKDAVAYDDLPSIDRWMLGRLAEAQAEAKQAYEDLQFYRAAQAVQQLCIADLSNFYFEVAKDRLYVSAADGHRRRSCQTVLAAALEVVATAAAPMLPHLAEDAWLALPWPAPTRSVFQAGWRPLAHPPHRVEEWGAVRRLRADVNRCMEAARTDGLLGASLEAAVYIHAGDGETARVLGSLLGAESMLAGRADVKGPHAVDDLRFILLSSQVHLVGSAAAVEAASAPAHRLPADRAESGCTVAVARAAGRKCDRCWFYHEPAPAGPGPDDICPRCATVVSAAAAAAAPVA